MNSNRNVDRRDLPKIVGTARNEFGTRLCQRIECIRCRKSDHVPVRVSSKKKGYCRSCAEILLKTFDSGRYLGEAKVAVNCFQCARPFEVSEKIKEKKTEILCTDCYRGFDVWRGKARHQSENSESRFVVSKSGAKIMIRKRDK